MKQTLLLIGCGDIALRSTTLLHSHYRLVGLCRYPENAPKLRQHGIIPITGDLDKPRTLNKISGIAHAILYLAPPPNHGKRDTRITNLLASLTKRVTVSKILPQRFLYISTSGVYGDCNGALTPETRPINPRINRSIRRADAEKQLRNWGLRNHINVSILRVPGIYAIERLPLKRIREGAPTLVPEDDCYTNSIHANDLVYIIFAALRYAKPGRVYNACDDSNLKMGEYFDLIADSFSMPRPPRIARANAHEHISNSMLSFMEESRRLTNTRIKNELYIELHYPTVAQGISEDKATKSEKR
ncbi:MAG: NAD(P)-dependent oxidoreductase [Nitrosomonadaceae bacterium]|nr:NAD(P)-dependent oxidoreductase [Nitrosomonadaceae bacterium]|tara:strand:- start:1399 stop:2301 length:903 start_codon:yes stop_codon:yes gene_type:complete